MANLLEIQNLSVSFDTHAGEVQAVRDVSLSLPEGKAVAVPAVKQHAHPLKKGDIDRAGQDILREHHSFPVFKDGLRKCYEYVLSVR